jgi:hypothetical protein
MYSSLRELRTASAKPPARAARRVLGSNVGNVCSSARKRLSYGPPWAHYIGGYQDRLLGGPWDYPACATRHLKAWSTRTTQE